ncbi:putative cytochrome P450 [Helianthus annuus]|nr:putative cytochrome P450 [Helianthus annuus]KAJ0576696.1 putative cytochrome P450 [Helianthus annuus]KAJ0584323.1 putative cytochrome P450 [Helianthus annuus]KAJ0746955.1 putative cytochrome P450 [Helianthus annuus]KAJ0918677.1 putative cytochrome P450 [Helianthus annuus]
MAKLNSHGLWWWEATMNSKKDEFTLAILVTIAVVTLAVLWYKFTHSSASPRLPPGPRSLPIVGYLPFLGPELHKQFTRMAHTYGPIFKLHLGSKLHVVINSSELAKEVVRDHDEIFANRNLTVAASVLSYGGQDLVWSMNNSNWRKLRKIFVHEALSSKNLESCSSFRMGEVRKTIKNVFSKISTPIVISEITFMTQTNVLTSLICGNTSNSSHLASELQTVSENLAEIFRRPNLSDFFPILAWFDLQRIERNMKKLFHKTDQIAESMIQDGIKSNSKKSLDGVGDREKKKDFLQILLDLRSQEDGNSLSITQIKALILVNVILQTLDDTSSTNDICSDIMVAGTETTSTLIEWVMAEIMMNHQVMNAIQEELAKVVGLNNIVEETHLSQLKYLDAVVKETLRLHPVVPFLIPRSPSQDCKVGGYTIPKGCTVFLNVWSIQRDPRYWDKPLEFYPKRFLSYESSKKYDYKGNNLKFFPFGSGRRLCAGLPLAEKMTLFILASLLHSFNWSLPKGEEHDLSEKFGITLTKVKPLTAIPSQRLPNASLYN